MHFENNTVIHCKTQKEANELIDMTKSNKIFKSLWKDEKEKTCYRIIKNIIHHYDGIEYYKKNNYNIIEFSDLIKKQNLSTEEVLEIMSEICLTYLSSNCDCNNSECPLKDNDMCCAENFKKNAKKITEICTKWKSFRMNENKEPETEWVNVCRIIDIHNEEKKICVHEEEITGIPELAPYSAVQSKAEDIFKKYLKEHDGNFIMIIEQVCKVKEN